VSHKPVLVRCILVLAFPSFLSSSNSAQIQTTPGGQQPSVSAPRASRSSATRSIGGQVLARSGSPVSGAVVLLKDTKTLQVRSFIAQKDGSYHFFGLSMDVNYELRAQANGVTSKTRTISVFNSHTEVKLNLKLNKKLKS
jgi:hypothetical protein